MQPIEARKTSRDSRCLCVRCTASAEYLTMLALLLYHGALNISPCLLSAPVVKMALPRLHVCTTAARTDWHVECESDFLTRCMSLLP